MKIITAAVIKGGTGKTTTAAALAQAAHRDGKRVLAVDLDPQANFSFSIGADQNKAGAYQMFNGEPLRDMIQTTKQGIDCVAASPNLATIKTTPGSAKRLSKALATVADAYDIVLIDTPPQMGELTFNALQAATGLIVPLETDNNSLQGLYQILDIAAQVQQTNPQMKILGTVITRYDPRPNINKYLMGVISQIGKEAGAPLLATIRTGVAVREAQAMQEDLYSYARHSKPATDYMKLYKMIMEE